MLPKYRKGSLHPNVLAVMEETGQIDPYVAVRDKAQDVVKEFHGLFGAIPPFQMEALASFRGLHSSVAAPQYSQDSEIVPGAGGRIVLRVNRDRPQTRQRFSIGHEIGHTLFPEYELAVRCRKVTERDWADPSDLLETLCDVAASEFILPAPWFCECVAQLSLSAEGVALLASKYLASRDATVRRVVELHYLPLAAVFLSWKLKPSELKQKQSNGCKRGRFNRKLSPKPEPKLRVNYAIVNEAFARQCCDHIPKDKSIPSKGTIYDASVFQEPRDGDLWLDFGRGGCHFEIHALPIYTPEGSLGPNGAASVVAILHPVNLS